MDGTNNKSRVVAAPGRRLSLEADASQLAAGRRQTPSSVESEAGPTIDSLDADLNLVPPDTPKILLPGKLAPILQKLAALPKATVEAYLQQRIKPRYGLSQDDIVAYRADINKQRRRPAQQGPAERTFELAAVLPGLVDLVEQDGAVRYLMKDAGKLAVLDKLERNGCLYVPPPREQLPWLLPRAEQVLQAYGEKDEVLYEDLWAYHHAISELPAPEYYDLLVAWDFHTYWLEAIQFSPVICLYAVPERGKSRTGKGMIYVAYRGIYVECLREAYLLRVGENLQASIFFDVRDVWRKALLHNSDDILLQRFEKGLLIPRVQFPDRGPHRDTVFYVVFGPTVISTNEAVHHILDTRTVPINMPETSRRFPQDVTPEYALPLKERLVAHRARHLGEVLPDCEEPADGRLGKVLKPLRQIIRLVKPAREPALMKLIRQIELSRLLDKSESFDAELLAAVLSLAGQVEHGILPIKTITDAFNEGRPEKGQITYHRAGHRLKALGFTKVRTGSGAAAIIYNEGHIARMAHRYGLDRHKLDDIAEPTSPEEDNHYVPAGQPASTPQSPPRDGQAAATSDGPPAALVELLRAGVTIRLRQQGDGKYVLVEDKIPAPLRARLCGMDSAWNNAVVAYLLGQARAEYWNKMNLYDQQWTFKLE